MGPLLLLTAATLLGAPAAPGDGPGVRPALTPPAPGGNPGAQPALTPAAQRARTPPEGAWSTAAFDAARYFDGAERRTVAARATARRRVTLIGLGVDLLWYALFLLTAWAVWLRDAGGRWAAGLATRWPWRTAGAARLARVPRRLFGDDWAGAWLFTWVYFGLGSAVWLPLALWSEALEQAAGMSTYGPGSWAWDATKQTLIQLALFSCLVFGLYGLVRRLPRRWWLALGLPAALALVAYGVLEPRFARIYDDVTPLAASKDPAHRALATRLGTLARAEGVSLARIHVLRASRTTRALDAYLVGLGDSRELVLFDTLLREAPAREVEVAVAHELGHEHQRRDTWTYAMAALALLGLLWLLGRVLRWGGARPGRRGPGDVATLPLLGFTLWFLFQAIHPAVAWQKRARERAADRRALVLTGDPEAFARLQVRLAVRNQQELRPPAWVTVLWSTHPSPAERLATARWYAQWLRQRGLPVPP